MKLRGPRDACWAAVFHALGTLVLAIAALRFAASLLIPIAVAVLLAFLLTPLVRRTEALGAPRVLAVGSAVFAVILAMGGLGWVVAHQTNQLLDAFPHYEVNLRTKLAVLRSDDGTMFSKLRAVARKVDEEMSGESKETPSGGAAMKVTVVEPESEFNVDDLPALAGSAAPVVGGTLLSFALLAFMLMRREDLRERMFRLVGRTRLPITTRALDDAWERITRTLLVQFGINASFGVVYGIGLYLIGIAFAPLWGLLAIALRYVPFVGSALALALPFAVSLLMMQGWTEPLLVVAWFALLVIGLIGVEALFLSPGIGVSPTATLVMLAFWTWLWGPIALLLATPLTACVMVIARFLPQLKFIEVALGDRPVLSDRERLYQRLLSGDLEESAGLFEGHARAHGYVNACDDLLMPTVADAAMDASGGRITSQEYDAVLGHARGVLEASTARSQCVAQSGSASDDHAPRLRVLCIARDAAEGLGHAMLQGALEPRKFDVEIVSSDLLVSETVELIGRYDSQVVCIGSVQPGSVLAAKLLCRRLRRRFPGMSLFVTRWGASDRDLREREALRAAGASALYTSIDQTRLGLITIHSSRVPAAIPSAMDAVASAAAG